MYSARRCPQDASSLYGVGVRRSFSDGGSHGAPAVWLGARGTYLICPILRRRYLASLSLSRSRVKVRLNAQSGKGDALHFALICLEVKDSPHEL